MGILTAAATTPFIGLLDTYPNAALAYSLRQLRTTYTGPAIRVRRSSDNAETDIGFAGNVLDTATLLTFCGVVNGFVTIWYDQSGNSRNATQTILISQPQIVDNGNLININGKPSLKVDINDWLDVVSISIPIKTTFSVFKRLANTSKFFSYNQQYIFSDNIYYYEFTSAFIASNTQDTTANQLLFSLYNPNATSAFQYKNNVLINSTSTVSARGSIVLYLFKYLNTSFSEGNSQEFIMYDFDNSSNLSAINTSINSFYTIY